MLFWHLDQWYIPNWTPCWLTHRKKEQTSGATPSSIHRRKPRVRPSRKKRQKTYRSQGRRFRVGPETIRCTTVKVVYMVKWFFLSAYRELVATESCRKRNHRRTHCVAVMCFFSFRSFGVFTYIHSLLIVITGSPSTRCFFSYQPPRQEMCSVWVCFVSISVWEDTNLVEFQLIPHSQANILVKSSWQKCQLVSCNRLLAAPCCVGFGFQCNALHVSNLCWCAVHPFHLRQSAYPIGDVLLNLIRLWRTNIQIKINAITEQKWGTRTEFHFKINPSSLNQRSAECSQPSVGKLGEMKGNRAVIALETNRFGTQSQSQLYDWFLDENSIVWLSSQLYD